MYLSPGNSRDVSPHRPPVLGYRHEPMVEVINLRTVRKRAKRQQDDEHANANRAVHGQPKHVRTLDKALRAKADRALDQHMIDNGDGQ